MFLTQKTQITLMYTYVPYVHQENIRKTSNWSAKGKVTKDSFPGVPASGLLKAPQPVALVGLSSKWY